MQMKYLTAAVACALAVMSTGHALAAQGVSSSQDAYLQAVAPGVEFTAVLTTGDAVGGYRMAGLPDGLGAYDNGDNTFTVLMNHEFGAGSGAASHGTLGAGSFISEWVINKTTLQVVSGGDLIKNVYGWDAATQQSSTVASLGVSFNRFCSADLAQSTAFITPPPVSVRPPAFSSMAKKAARTVAPWRLSPRVPPRAAHSFSAK